MIYKKNLYENCNQTNGFERSGGERFLDTDTRVCMVCVTVHSIVSTKTFIFKRSMMVLLKVRLRWLQRVEKKTQTKLKSNEIIVKYTFCGYKTDLEFFK